jgi:ParB-like chromosome segregation protein Spo0J
MKLEIDPEFEALIPALTEEETADLAASLKRDGCRDAIVVWKGIVVDGHNRYRICTENKIPFKTWELRIGERANVIQWMIRNQFGRRNLTAYARSTLALRLEETLKDRAKANQSAGGRNKSASELLTNSAEAVHIRKAVAQEAKVSEDTIAKVKVIEAKADEETKAALRDGTESVNSAYKKVTGKVPESCGDKVVDRARARIPELIRNLKFQFGNLGIGGKYDSVLDQMLEDAR